jgi:hypothetical protein
MSDKGLRHVVFEPRLHRAHISFANRLLRSATCPCDTRRDGFWALPCGGGALEPLRTFMTNPARSAIVNVVGPIRQVVEGADQIPRRCYLVIVPGAPEDHGAAVQVQRW